MAKTLSKSGIFTGYDVNAWHVTQSVDAFTKVEAYDITVSGSFTVTGSVKVSGTVFGRTTASSSRAITSSYAIYTPTVTSASIANYNTTNQYTLQFYSPTNISSILNSTTYGIGAGEPLIAGPGNYGITLPVDSILQRRIVVVTTSKAQGTLTGTLSLMSGNNTTVYTFSNPVIYNKPYVAFIEDPISTTFTKGTRLWFKLVTKLGTLPTFVSHNIILTFLPR